MGKWIRRALLALGVLCASQPAAAQGLNIGTVTDGVRRQLAADWNDTLPSQHERAYCAYYRMRASWGYKNWFEVYAVEPAQILNSSTYSVKPLCPPASNVAMIHTHGPATCDQVDQLAFKTGQCYLGGSDAYECFPSLADRRFLVRRGDRFNIVQCDRHALVFFYPDVEPPLPPEPLHPSRRHAVFGVLAITVLVLVSRR